MECGTRTEIIKIFPPSARAEYKDTLFKTMLLALTAAQRENEIVKLNIQYTVKTDSEFTFSIAGTTKTSTQGKKVPDITFHLFQKNRFALTKPCSIIWRCLNFGKLKRIEMNFF